MPKTDDWLEVLRKACTPSVRQPHASQRKVADRLGVSAAMVNQALQGIYKGRLDKLKARVMGELMNKTVTCPVLGEISTRRCEDEQTRPFAPTNPQRVAVYKACRAGCPHFRRQS